jgi:hypothetical protein
MNLIDQAKTIMQEIKKKQIECDIVWNSHRKGIARLCEELALFKAKASQMLIDLTNEKEDFGDLLLWNKKECNACEGRNCSINKKIKEINSALEILGGKNGN